MSDEFKGYSAPVTSGPSDTAEQYQIPTRHQAAPAVEEEQKPVEKKVESTSNDKRLEALRKANAARNAKAEERKQAQQKETEKQA